MREYRLEDHDVEETHSVILENPGIKSLQKTPQYPNQNDQIYASFGKKIGDKYDKDIAKKSMTLSHNLE